MELKIGMEERERRRESKRSEEKRVKEIYKGTEGRNGGKREKEGRREGSQENSL